MRAILFGLVLVSLGLLPGGRAQADTIVVVSDSWYPYNGAPGDAKEGYKIDLLRWIAQANGHSVDYRLLDWELALERTLAGNGGDCVVGATVGDAPDHARTAQPWGKSVNTFYGHIDRMPTITSYDSLRELRVGVVEDYAYGDEIDAIINAEGAKVLRVAASRRAFPLLVMRLATRQVDVIIEDFNVATAGLAEIDMAESIKPVEVDFMEPDDLFVACTPNARGQTFIALFDAGMARARAEGKLAEILAKYELDDWTGVE